MSFELLAKQFECVNFGKNTTLPNHDVFCLEYQIAELRRNFYELKIRVDEWENKNER